MKNKTDQFLEQLHERLHAFSMQSSVRDAIRERLVAYMEVHPLAIENVPVVSPWSYLHIHALRVVAIFVVVGVVSSSVAFAAEGTIPGDVLYPVKTDITEPLIGTLQATPEAKGAWNATVAERRLSEATELAAAHQLSEPTQATLAASFVEASDAANANANTLAASGNVASALSVRSDLEARLDAHADLLALLATHGQDTEAGQLLATVETTRGTVDAARAHDATELADNATSTASINIDAATLATDQAVEAARTTGSGAIGTIASRLTSAQTQLTNARVALAANKRGGAYVAVADAARSTHEAAILMKNKKLILSLNSVNMTSAVATASTSDTVASSTISGSVITAAVTSTTTSTTSEASGTTTMTLIEAKTTTYTAGTAPSFTPASFLTIPSLPHLPSIQSAF
jgi:hypothetical protein